MLAVGVSRELVILTTKCLYLRSRCRGSRSNLNRDLAARRRIPNVQHLLIGDGDASVCPIEQTMEPSEPPEPVLDAVNHDIATSISRYSCGALPVFGVRIRDL